MTKYLCDIEDPKLVITPIDSALRFPEILEGAHSKYKDDIELFGQLVAEANSSADLLGRIRSPAVPAERRISLLKLFRRCVAPVLDTETTRKIAKNPTERLVEAYGATFKPIEKLKAQFAALTTDQKSALAALLGEYDGRGQSGYALTEAFFDWFETTFKEEFTIEGPRGAGRDVELSSIFPDFTGNYPCDFVVRRKSDATVLGVGFARYDSTRGGAQSDDRTGGNAYKVAKAREYCTEKERSLRIIFLADGPGLAHGDTWYEACELDGAWDGAVRVTTLKLAPKRITAAWLLGQEEVESLDSNIDEALDLLAKTTE